MTTASAYQPILQSITEVSEQLSQFSVINGEPQNLNDFATVSHGISRAGLQNFTKFDAENCVL